MSSRRNKSAVTANTTVVPPPPSTPPAAPLTGSGKFVTTTTSTNRRQQRSVSRSRQRETQLLPPIRPEYDDNDDNNDNLDDNNSQASLESFPQSHHHHRSTAPTTNNNTTTTTTTIGNHQHNIQQHTVPERSFQPLNSSHGMASSRGLARRPSTEGIQQHNSGSAFHTAASRGSGTVALSSLTDPHQSALSSSSYHPSSAYPASSSSSSNTGSSGVRWPLGISLPSSFRSTDNNNTTTTVTSPHYSTNADAHIYTSPNGTMHTSHPQPSPRPHSPSNSSSSLYSSSHFSHFNRPLTIPPRPSWLLLKLQTPMGIIIGGLLVALSSLFLFALIHRTRALGGGLSALADAFVDVTGFSGMTVRSYVPERVRGALGLETGLDYYHTSISRTVLQVNDTVYEVPIDWDLRSKLLELVLRLRKAEDGLIQQHAVLSVEVNKLSNIASESDSARQQALISAELAMAKTNESIGEAKKQLINITDELNAKFDQAVINEAQKFNASFHSLQQELNTTEQSLKSVEEIASKAEAQAKHNTYDLISNVSPRLQKLENQTINAEQDIIVLKAKGLEYAQSIGKLMTDLGSLDKAYKALEPVTMQNKNDIQKIQEQIQTIENLEKTITTDITVLQQSTNDLTNHTKVLDEYITNITTAADSLEAKLKSFQDSVGNQFTEVNKQAKTASTAIDELRNKNREFLTSLDNLTKMLNAIDSTLATKVSITTFKEFQENIGQRFNETMTLLSNVTATLVTVNANLSKFIEESVQAVENRMKTGMDTLSTTLNHKIDTLKETNGIEFDTVKNTMANNYQANAKNYSVLTTMLTDVNRTLFTSLVGESTLLMKQLNQFHNDDRLYTETLVTDLSVSLLRTISDLNTSLLQFDERTKLDMTEFTEMVTDDVQRLNSSYILRLQNMNVTLNRALERLYEIEVIFNKQNGGSGKNNEPLYQNVREVKNEVDRYTELFQSFQNFTARMDGVLDTEIGATLDRLTVDMDNVYQSIEALSTRYTENIDNVTNVLRSEIDAVKQAMDDNDNAISSATSANFEIVQSSLFSLLDKLKEINNTLYTSVPDLINQSQNDMQSVVGNGINDIHSRLDEFYRTVRYVGQAIGIEQIQDTINELNDVVNSNENEDERIYPRPVSLPSLIDALNTTTYTFMNSIQNQLNNLQLVHGSSDDQLLSFSQHVEQITEAFTKFQETTNGNFNSVNTRVDELTVLVQTMTSTLRDDIPAEFERIRTAMETKVDSAFVQDQMNNLNATLQSLAERITLLEENMYRIDTPLFASLVASYNASVQAHQGMEDTQASSSLTRIVSQLGGTTLRKDTDLTTATIRHIWPDGTHKDGLATLLASSSPDNTDVSSSMDRVALLSDITALLDKTLAMNTADSIALPDYALAAGGAWIINETYFTSDTWHPDHNKLPHHHSNSLLALAAHHARTTFTALVTGTPYAALTADTSVGSCWPMVGTKGVLSVHLAAPIMLTAVTIDHLPRELKMGRTPMNAAISSSAVKHFSIYGLKGNTTNDLRNKVLLGNFQYDAVNGPSTQTFHLHPPGGIPVPRTTPVSSEYPIVQLEIQDNYGNPNFTCLYRFRVHGYPIGGVGLGGSSNIPPNNNNNNYPTTTDGTVN